MINVFTLRDFKYQGGGMIRILGILRTLDTNTKKIRLFSNKGDTKCQIESTFPDLDICPFYLLFSKRDKKLFQFFISIFPIFLVNLIFQDKYRQIKTFTKKYNLKDQVLFCCEYLDLSLGYYMMKNGLISGYVCDIHGLVPNEFITKKDKKIYNYFRFFSATILDKKVFSSSQGVIYASLAMRKYMENKIPELQNIKNVIIPYLISKESIDKKVCISKYSAIKEKYSIKEQDDVIFFAGSFKELGGIMDLLKAFQKLAIEKDKLKLIIIGEGEEVDNVNSFIEINQLEERVVHISQISYGDLRTYQEISDIIVCPDRDNLYSNMILHLKYIDSLASNKIVINGEFDAVKEVNHSQNLSINFSPSNIDDLYKKMKYCLENKKELQFKYKSNIDYVRSNMLYETLDCSISELL